jgi:serine/threonine protein kinase
MNGLDSGSSSEEAENEKTTSQSAVALDVIEPDLDTKNAASDDETIDLGTPAKIEINGESTIGLSSTGGPGALWTEALDSLASLSGRYKLIQVLGQGGMGIVAHARDIELEADVAVKVLFVSNGSGDKELPLRFLREAKALANLNHENVVKIRNSGVTVNGDLYHVMELLKGRSLKEELELAGKLTVDQILDVFLQTVRGLQHAHESSVVHRDIKPSNIMLCYSQTGDLEIKLIDFGIARFDPSSTDNLTGTITRTDSIVGSPAYMSPEQCQGTSINHLSDVYSLGCVLFECVTGAPPFDGNTVLRIMYRHMTEPARSLEPDATDDRELLLYQLIGGCLNKRSEDRPQGMVEVKKVLEEIKGTIPGRRDRHPARKRSSSVAVQVSLLLAVTVLPLAVVWNRLNCDTMPVIKKSSTEVKQPEPKDDAILQSELEGMEAEKQKCLQPIDPASIEAPITRLSKHATRAAQVLMKRSNYDEAFNLYGDALSYCNVADFQGGMCNMWLHISRADCCRRKGDYVQAEVELAEASKMAKEHSTCRWNWLRSTINLHLSEKKWSNLMDDVEMIPGIWANSTAAHIKLAAAAVQCEEFTACYFPDELQRVSQLLKNTPPKDNTEAMMEVKLQNKLAGMLLEIGDDRRARQCLNASAVGLKRLPATDAETKSLVDETTQLRAQLKKQD